MTRRSKVWLVLASIFTLINLAGAGFAAASAEGIHTGVHVALGLLGAYVVWRLAPRTEWQNSSVQRADDRLDQLQQSVDAVALEVERIGEAQRFSAKLQAERSDTRQ